ncbi:MAG: response regulator [Planctomycetes bacterium]|nr:response regulator [Planctomycetota bacterium]
MSKQRILAVDDEEDILELLEYNLSREGFRVQCVTNGEEALKAVQAEKPDLVLLDLMLPGTDGLEVCRSLKGEPGTKPIPVVMLTAKGEEADIVAGLELGADDYITKPFSPRVLLARIKAVLRRPRGAASDDGAVLSVGDLKIDPRRHEVVVKGKAVELTYTEFRILHFLARRPGWVFTRYQIVDGSQGEDVAVTDRSVDVHIVSLRRKLGPCSDYIETVRGVGYRFKDV